MCPEVYIYEGQGHVFFHISKGGRKMFESVLTRTDAFLVKHKFLSGKGSVKEWTAKSVANAPRVGVKKAEKSGKK
jgi:hypothetical protein